MPKVPQYTSQVSIEPELNAPKQTSKLNYGHKFQYIEDIGKQMQVIGQRQRQLNDQQDAWDSEAGYNEFLNEHVIPANQDFTSLKGRDAEAQFENYRKRYSTAAQRKAQQLRNRGYSSRAIKQFLQKVDDGSVTDHRRMSLHVVQQRDFYRKETAMAMRKNAGYDIMLNLDYNLDPRSAEGDISFLKLSDANRVLWEGLTPEERAEKTRDDVSNFVGTAILKQLSKHSIMQSKWRYEQAIKKGWLKGKEQLMVKEALDREGYGEQVFVALRKAEEEFKKTAEGKIGKDGKFIAGSLNSIPAETAVEEYMNAANFTDSQKYTVKKELKPLFNDIIAKQDMYVHSLFSEGMQEINNLTEINSPNIDDIANKYINHGTATGLYDPKSAELSNMFDQYKTMLLRTRDDKRQNDLMLVREIIGDANEFFAGVDETNITAESIRAKIAKAMYDKKITDTTARQLFNIMSQRGVMSHKNVKAVFNYLKDTEAWREAESSMHDQAELLTSFTKAAYKIASAERGRDIQDLTPVDFDAAYSAVIEQRKKEWSFWRPSTWWSNNPGLIGNIEESNEFILDNNVFDGQPAAKQSMLTFIRDIMKLDPAEYNHNKLVGLAARLYLGRAVKDIKKLDYEILEEELRNARINPTITDSKAVRRAAGRFVTQLAIEPLIDFSHIEIKQKPPQMGNARIELAE